MSEAKRDRNTLQGGARGGTLGGRIVLRMAGRVHPAILGRIAASDPRYPWRKRKKDAPCDPSVQLFLPGLKWPGPERVQ